MELVYRTQDLAALGPEVEVVVRRDVGATGALRYETSLGSATPVPRGWEAVGTIRIDLPWPSGAAVHGDLVRFGPLTYLGSLRFEIELDRPVDRDVVFLRGGRPGTPTFAGGRTATRLNAVPSLAGRAARVLRDAFFSGTLWVKGAGCGLTLSGAERGTTLQLWTYSRTTGILARNATTDAGTVLEIAREIRQAL